MFFYRQYWLGLLIVLAVSLARDTQAETSNWSFTHGVVDPAPPAAYRINDMQIGDINGDGTTDIWTTGRGAGTDVYQMVWYEGPSWIRHEIAPGDFKYGNLGDVDGDGDLDVIVDQYWFENTGHPEDRDWPRYSLGFEQEVDLELVGDLNQDDRLDIVFNTKTELYWIPGPDDPRGVWTPVLIGSSGLLTGGSLVDIDGDSDLDITWGNSWVENPDDPSVIPWPIYPIDATWTGEARSTSGDLNGDGRLEILLSGEESRDGMVWYTIPDDPRNGPWERHDLVRQDYQGVHSLRAADFDRDGDLDVFAAEMHHGDDPDKISIFENVNGDASAWTEHILDTIGTHNAKVGDVNGDGYPDIVGKNYEAGALPLQIDLWLNTLGGTVSAPQPVSSLLAVDQWQRFTIETDRPWRAVFITGGDINGDGLADIIAGGWWYENPGSASGSWTRHTIGGELYNMAVVWDFDHDGDLDVLGTNGQEEGNKFFWGENDSSGIFTLHTNVPAGNGDFLQGARVIPGSNAVVLSWHNETSTQMLQPSNPPTQGEWIWSEISPTTTGEQVAVGDLDRDGDYDLHLGTVWLRNDTIQWTPFEAVTFGDSEADPDRVELADIDADGDLDVIIGAEHANRLVWGEAPADPTQPWIEHVISTDSLAMSMDVADLDHDGDTDIVVGGHTGDGRVFIFVNDTQGQNWTPLQIDSGFEHHIGTQLIDIEGDGDLDIISTGWNHDQIALYENQAITEQPLTQPAPPTFSGASERVVDGVQILYTFDEGSGGIVHDTSGVGEPIDLTIHDPSGVTWLSGALQLDNSTLIVSGRPLTRVVQACQSTNAITLEAWITPTNVLQNGPARIMTFSNDAESRNFTLGQGESDSPSDFYIVRLRTTAQSDNGKPSLDSASGTLTPTLTHVVYTREASGVVRLYLNGIEQVSATVEGDFSNWDPTFRFALGNEIDGNRAWLGSYDLVAVYCRALSPSDVHQNFDAGP